MLALPSLKQASRVLVWCLIAAFYGFLGTWAAGWLPIGLDPIFQKTDATRQVLCFGSESEPIEAIFSDSGRVVTLRFRQNTHRLGRKTGHLAPEDFYTDGTVSLRIDPEIFISGLTAEELRHCEWG